MSLVNETESRRVLGQWLRSLNVTQWIGVENFEFSSGSCQNWDVKKIIKIGLFALVVAGVFIPMVMVWLEGDPYKC